MPLYDYDCAACGRRFEVIHGVNDPAPAECPLCGAGPIRKAFAPPAIHFKGSGWAKKERRAAVKSGASSSTDGDTASDGEGSTKTTEKSTEKVPENASTGSTSSTSPTSSSEPGATSGSASTSSGSTD